MNRSQLLRTIVAAAGLGTLVVGPVMAQDQSAAPAPASVPEKIGISEVPRTPPGFASNLVALGREVYADLLDASDAAWSHDATALRLALMNARSKLTTLSSSADERALKAQTGLIERDLSNRQKPPNKELWAPVSAELERVMVAAPEALRAQARKASEEGAAAAERGDRAKAQHDLAVLVQAIEYQFQVFPLRHLREDVQSAWQTASLPQPDWAATQEALRHAVALVHWYSRVEADGLIQAYYDLADAYTVWPHHKDRARDDLKQAAQDLAHTPNADALARQMRSLATKSDLTFADINGALTTLRHQVDAAQSRAEQTYLKSSPGKAAGA